MVRFASARIDERGRASGGKAGDQTGREVSIQPWYKHKKKWVVIRAKSAAAAAIIARTMEAIANNKLIGYDQHQRNDLWNALKAAGFNLNALGHPVEIDCSSGVRFCAAVAGIIASNFTTATEVSHLRATGAFVILTAPKYINQSAYLRKGDILCTQVQGHTGVILDDGPKAWTGSDVPLGARELSRGADGDDVEELQEALAALGFDPEGIDGQFGPNTEKAVKGYQKARKLPATGKADAATIEAIKADVAAKEDPDEPEPEPETGIKITADTVNIRTGPGTNYAAVGQARRGEVFPLVDSAGWRPLVYGDSVRWASADYTEVK